MKQLAGYITQFLRDINRKTIFAITLFTAAFVCLNQFVNLEKTLLRSTSGWQSFIGFVVLYLSVFGGSYLLVFLTRPPGCLQPGGKIPAATSFAGRSPTLKQCTGGAGRDPFLYVLILVTTCFFAWRISSGVTTHFIDVVVPLPWQQFARITANPPFKFLLLLIMIAALRAAGNYKSTLTGLQKQSPSLTPFLLMLLLFIPFIFLAANHPDFLVTYPRLKLVDKFIPGNSQRWLTAVIFEIAYAFDFVTAEVFFRGILVFAFVRYAGAAAILPMAAFYCAIHFGKPFAECVSSYFGGILLGIIAYRTGSVVGGLVLHLGVGWIMEIAGIFYT